MTSAATIRTLADVVGRGLFAGLAGTAAMTVSSTVEARLNKRGASSAPADAAATVAGVEPTESGRTRFNSMAHWGYGTGWGIARGLLSLTGMSAPAATAAHLGAVWGAEQAVLPALGVGAPVWKYGASATGTDALHHTVYAVATGLAYAWLDSAPGR
ncbi:hypothetical protein [Streptomyces sp. TP-A0874]|uniref:hypothetical protein n=1 Tax=Streptomyces sp. TP-A0874 TaxID=549819 RepID=UPI000852D0C1|nr:hypothetical protein [Streptomyces sp. TP-A0874]